jgi:hypothetical protein
VLESPPQLTDKTAVQRKSPSKLVFDNFPRKGGWCLKRIDVDVILVIYFIENHEKYAYVDILKVSDVTI